VLPLTALGLTADRLTSGHRFHTHAPISIGHANDYASTLQTQGKVIASFDTRQTMICHQLKAMSGPDQVVMPEALLDEVTSLVEWPVALEAYFEEEFLSVPQECLILTMQQNQKYFALTNQQGKLKNRFLLVTNIESKDPTVIVNGNERVLRARLSDAKFFFDQDRKKTLFSRLDHLSAVVYHNKIGNQRQRIDRLASLSERWAPAVGAEPAHAKRAAYLAKADLLTDMVGEFPELQGIIGTYYALHDGEPQEVAKAIADHYRPRFAGDALATTPAGNALALADKLETIVGIWGIGLAPTGDKDPFALRRHALGVVRILAERELPLSLEALLKDTAATFVGVPNVAPDLHAIAAFILDRLRAWLKEKGFIAEEIEAVLAVSPNNLDQVQARLHAVRAFMRYPEAQSLCAANKRITNILKKAQPANVGINETLLIEPAEKALAKALATVGPKAQADVLAKNYTQALECLAQVKAPVDAFFDSVMVMADDESLKQNRLALMQQLHTAMNQVADLSRLAA
jgi:glycyl-tRNA synthetase beta chain